MIAKLKAYIDAKVAYEICKAGSSHDSFYHDADEDSCSYERITLRAAAEALDSKPAEEVVTAGLSMQSAMNIIKGSAAVSVVAANGCTYWIGVIAGNRYCKKPRRTSAAALKDAKTLEAMTVKMLRGKQ